MGNLAVHCPYEGCRRSFSIDEEALARMADEDDLDELDMVVRDGRLDVRGPTAITCPGCLRPFDPYAQPEEPDASSVTMEEDDLVLGRPEERERPS